MIEKRWASNFSYDALKKYAAENRKYMTDGEYFLWQHIRNKALGVRFLRQYIIGDFIVDFICREDGLIIEVDGGYHAEPRQEIRDEQRSQILESYGFHIIRFTNEEILNEIDSVLLKIEDCLK